MLGRRSGYGCYFGPLTGRIETTLNSNSLLALINASISSIYCLCFSFLSLYFLFSFNSCLNFSRVSTLLSTLLGIFSGLASVFFSIGVFPVSLLVPLELSRDLWEGSRLTFDALLPLRFRRLYWVWFYLANGGFAPGPPLIYYVYLLIFKLIG